MTIGRIPSVEGGIQPTIVDAKGDLIAATAADTVNRLAVGSNDQVLVADSSTSTGLAWKSVATPFAAGKNCIINGDFRINQRAFTSSTTSTAYGFDRFRMIKGGTVGPTVTYSAQTFTAGAAPVAGYEGVNFARMATTTGSSSDEYAILQHLVEDIRTLGGKTVTVSFWAKAASGTPKVGIELYNNPGTGGSGTTNSAGQSVTISTSWARYSVTITTPTLSGATIGANSFYELNLWCSAGSAFNTRSGTVGNQSATIDFWGVQVEQGSVATAFQTATGTIQGELAACQRYYWRTTATTSATAAQGFGAAAATTSAGILVTYPTTMRAEPTSLDYSTLELGDSVNAASAVTSLSMDSSQTTERTAWLSAGVASGLTQYRPYSLRGANNTASYLGFSAEL